MAVGDGDAVPAQGRFQPPRARRRDGPLQPEVLDGHARSLELIRQPPLAAGREERHVKGPRLLQRSGEMGQDTLRSARPVRLDQVRDPQSGEVARSGDHRASCAPGYGNALRYRNRRVAPAAVSGADTFFRPMARASSVYSISE